jgi:hypothetical protein
VTVDILQPAPVDLASLGPEIDIGDTDLRTLLDQAAERAKEEAEREAQEKYDEDERRRRAARERARREAEEAQISGTLSGDAEVFHDLTLKPRLKEIHAYEQQVREPVVQGLLFKNTLAWLAGSSGTFKSFVAADLAFRYGSEDMDYHGRRMTKGRSLLVIAEGAAGYADRRVAWEREHGREVKEVVIYPAPLQLADVQKEMPALLHHLREESEAGRPYGLIVFDTQAMCTVGVDENTSEMNLVINVLHRIREASGACVLTVHHFGKSESKGMRGSSMIYAAADTVIVMDRDKEALRVTLSTGGEHGKQKDAVAEKDFLTLQMRTRQVGLDYFNDPVDSLVPVQADVVPEIVEEAEPLPQIADIDLFYLKALGTFEGDGALPTVLRARVLEAAEDESDEYHKWLKIPDGHDVKPQTPSSRLQRLKNKGLADRIGSKGTYVITVRGHQVIAREIMNRERIEESWARAARPKRYSRSTPGGTESMIDIPG